MFRRVRRRAGLECVCPGKSSRSTLALTRQLPLYRPPYFFTSPLEGKTTLVTQTWPAQVIITFFKPSRSRSFSLLATSKSGLSVLNRSSQTSTRFKLERVFYLLANINYDVCPDVRTSSTLY